MAQVCFGAVIYVPADQPTIQAGLDVDAHGPYTICVNDAVQFTGSAVGGVPPYSWNWDFGDGSYSSEQSPLHLYEVAGIYSLVTLTVTDSEDIQSVDTTTVTVTHAPHSVVWVDDDYSEVTPGWGYDHFDAIEDAITLSGDTGTVHISSGSYAGDYLVERPIALLGESRSGTFISGRVLIYCPYVTVSGFGFRDSGLTIQIGHPASDVNISNNRIGGCRFGVILSGIGSGSIVTGNIIQNCGEAGLVIASVSANTVSNNVFISNETGVFSVDSSYDNLIYHNSFIGNSYRNAADDLQGSGNIWDSGYPAGGNYWSDYDEPSEGAYDLFSGENQDIPGSDGIADTSYYVFLYYPEVPGYSLDRYPLMEPLISIQCGDANYDGAVDIDDAVFLVSYIFAGGPEPTPYESGDADCSGEIDIDDVVWLIAYIFSGGNAPCDTDGDEAPDC
jgi:parallel beta-helix repeat protein